MLCAELGSDNMTVMSLRKGINEGPSNIKVPEKEAIHSGHFMVSEFEADDQDDEDEVAVPVPEEETEIKTAIPQPGIVAQFSSQKNVKSNINLRQQLSIETSLTKLFQCMSLAYRQKLTSPKWNRFKGIRLRWKDKIRLNNVIWRCWHMQFVNRKRTLVCQFASPLDIDTHNKPEAIVMEGKYWKRRLHAVTAEYKKWRMFYRNKLLGKKDAHDVLFEFDSAEWQTSLKDSAMMVDEDYMEFMSDTLFTTITANQPFAFPDTREIARGAGLADFIQPSLVQLQPNLDDYMDLEPFQDLLQSKLVEESYSSVGNSSKADAQYSVPDPKPNETDFYTSPGPWAMPAFPQELPQFPTHCDQIRPPITTTTNSLPKVSRREQRQPSNRIIKKTNAVDQSPLLSQMLTGGSGGYTGYNRESIEVKKTVEIVHPQSDNVTYIPQSSYQNVRMVDSNVLFQPNISVIKEAFIGNNLTRVITPQVNNPPPPPLPAGHLVNLNMMGTVNSPSSPSDSMSPINVGSPNSSPSPSKPKTTAKGERRVCLVNAEQKRRSNIKNGFDTLRELLPQSSQSVNIKVSKAALLQKGAEYIKQLKSDREQLDLEIENLKHQIEYLNSAISNCQEKLPATGAPISKQKNDNKMVVLYQQYVKVKTHENWKFWILSLICEPLLMSFNECVSTVSLDQLYNSTLQWLDQHCTLVELRPVVLNALRKLCTMTEVLTEPAKLADEARQAVDSPKKNS